MRERIVAAALAILATACSSGEADENPLAQGLANINTCEAQVDLYSGLSVLEAEFPVMQRGIRDGGVDSLSREHRQLHDMFYEFTTIEGVGFDPEILGPMYVPGETSLAELRDEAWIREVAALANVAAPIWREQWSAANGRYNRPLDLECAAIWSETTDWLCESGSEDAQRKACRLKEEYPDRDLDIIAEACEQVPYLLLCDPENAPAWITQEQLNNG